MEQQQEQQTQVDPGLVISHLRDELSSKTVDLAMTRAHVTQLEYALREAQETIDRLGGDEHSDDADAPEAGDNGSKAQKKTTGKARK